jgi:hypothetical protein
VPRRATSRTSWGWTSQRHSRLKAAEEAGFVVNLETVKGPAARYRATGGRADVDADWELLPTVELLRQGYEAERREAEVPAHPCPGKRPQRRNGLGLRA